MLKWKLFKFKFFSLCVNSESVTPIHPFYFCNQKKSLWSKLQDLLNSEILLPRITSQSASFGFPDNKENFEISNRLHLMLKYYLFKVWYTSKISLEGLNKNIITIYNIEKQISFNDSKKETLKKKHVLAINIIATYSKRCLGGGGKVNISV